MPGSSIVAVQFSKYTPGIFPVYALQCVAIAQRATAVQFSIGRGARIVNGILTYRFGTATLTVNAGRSVRWSDWGLVLSTMPELFAQYEYVGFEFMILVNNVAVGLGSLTWYA